MQKRSTACTMFSLVPVLGLVALGCQPSLPEPFPGSRPPEPDTEPHAVLEPDAPFDAASRVVRIRVVPAEGALADASRALFVKGHVGPAHVRQVQNFDVSEALSERVLAALTWADDDGSIVIAPGIALEPGVTYGVLSGDPPLGVDLRATAADSAAFLHKVWPPVNALGAGPFAIFCGDQPLAAPPSRVELDPGGVSGALARGVYLGMSPSCLRLDLLDAPEEAPGLVSPALVALADGSQIRLDPAPIMPVPSEAASPIEPLSCAPEEIAFGPGCARVADDRLLIATPDAPVFWALRSPTLGDVRRVTAASEPWVLLGLSPASHLDIKLLAMDVSGAAAPYSLEVLTAPPMPHVVLSEVLANPLGPEPDQEWVELYNDGLAAADLTGYVLADIGGKTALPAALLEPGAFALVVNESFVLDDEIDPAPVKGTTLLRVPELGNDGLKNDGEPLKLLAADGTVLSRFPIAPKPKAGQSVARVSPSAPDGDAGSFVAGTPTPGAPR